MVTTGIDSGLIVPGVIRAFNPNGTVRIGIRQQGNEIDLDVPMPLSWAGNRDEFIGGCPETGSNVMIARGQGGQWYVIGYLPSDNTLGRSYINPAVTRFSSLRPGRILLQARNNNRIYIDPKTGVYMGSSLNSAEFNPSVNLNLFSHNFKGYFSSTESSLSQDKVIRREKRANLSRGVIGSTLDSQAYETQIVRVGLDPIATVRPTTSLSNEESQTLRNPALAEKRELVYEFGLSFGFTTDRDEANRYEDPDNEEEQPQVSRRNMRADAFSLSLEHPNHLLETIKGTGVDIYGNILDLNRNILPLGRNDVNSLRNNKDKREAFARIRAQHRKSLAFHFEINARKGGSDPTEIEEPPSPRDTSDYARSRSRFFIDIDKEGQFKINVPASSEIGNVPLHTRYENFSVLEAARNDGETDPNEFLRNAENRDIFIENYSSGGGITLNSADPDSFQIPLNYQGEEEPIEFGTAFHNITETCASFQSSYDLALVQFQPGNRLNILTPYQQIVSNSITVSGEGANAGGRSGQLNLDGWLSLNIGANTIDRQSLWFDFAGGVVGRVGKDRNDISYALTTDGDVIMEIGGPGLGNNNDSRFADLDDSFVPRSIQIHVPTRNGPMIFKMGTDPGLAGGPAAIDLISPGAINIIAKQDITMESVQGRVLIEGQTIEMHPKTAQRQVLKIPGRSI
jgi:hypothetical protein